MLKWLCTQWLLANSYFYYFLLYVLFRNEYTTMIVPESRIVGVTVAARKARISVKRSVFVAEVLPFQWRNAFQVIFHHPGESFASACDSGGRCWLLADPAHRLRNLLTSHKLIVKFVKLALLKIHSVPKTSPTFSTITWKPIFRL